MPATPGLPAFMLTAFGLGRLRPAPGTWGSLPPVILVLGIVLAFPDVPRSALDGMLIALAVVFGAACVHWGHAAEIHFGRKDPSSVVADEVAGQAIALLFVPWSLGSGADFSRDVVLAGAAFVFFRAMDILKPWPARGLQRIGGGWGILIDDLVAGLYARLALELLLRTTGASG